jgi:hypothetical protein
MLSHPCKTNYSARELIPPPIVEKIQNYTVVSWKLKGKTELSFKTSAE